MPKHPKILIITNIPTYHQVDLFDALTQSDEYDIEIFYLRSMTPGRHWSKLPTPNHPHRMLPVLFEKSVYYLNPTFLFEFIKSKPDLLIIGQYAGFSYQMAMYLATMLKIPWIFWCEPMGVKFFEVRQFTPERIRSQMRKLAYFPAQKFAATHWGIGVKAKQQFEHLTGHRAENFPYFSNLARFNRADLSYAPEQKVRFLFAGRYSYRKGFDVLLDAFSKLSRRGIDSNKWHLTLCGKGELQEDINRHPTIKTNITDLGFQELSAMPDIMKTHDVFVAPSRYDGWGMVVPEALAAGMPVITTTAMGSGEDLGTPTKWLHLISADNSSELADSLQHFIENIDTLGQLGIQASEAAQRYDTRNAQAKFESLVKNALSTK